MTTKNIKIVCPCKGASYPRSLQGGFLPIQQTCNHEWILTLRINHTLLCRPIKNVGIYIAYRHWCMPHVTISGTPCIEPNSHQDYCSKNTLYLPDTASFIIRTAVLTGGFLPHASRGLLTPLTPF